MLVKELIEILKTKPANARVLVSLFDTEGQNRDYDDYEPDALGDTREIHHVFDFDFNGDYETGDDTTMEIVITPGDVNATP